MSNNAGFSLVELIVVIVLLGITGAVLIPRLLAPSSFEIAAAQDGLIATIRAAQQASLGRNETTGTVTFEIDGAFNGHLRLAAKTAGSDIRTFDLPAGNLYLETGSAAASADNCATAFDIAVDGSSNFTLVFDKLGNLSQFSNTGVPLETVDDNFNGVRICVNDTDALSVCVSPAGYAYAGNCDE